METTFSEHMGLSRPKALQLEGMDDDLRNSLWDVVVGLVGENWERAAEGVASQFKKVPVDEVNEFPDCLCRRWLRDYFLKLRWNRVYDFIELFVAMLPWITRADQFRWEQIIENALQLFNHVLEQELSGYRFVAAKLVPISDPVEMNEIEAAVDASAKAGLLGPRDHIHTALELLAKKPTPTTVTLRRKRLARWNLSPS
jgi:hypothetical protein